MKDVFGRGMPMSMNDRLSRRYFGRVFALGAAGLLVGAHVAKKAVGAIVPEAPLEIVTTRINATAKKLRVNWRAEAKPDLVLLYAPYVPLQVTRFDFATGKVTDELKGET